MYDAQIAKKPTGQPEKPGNLQGDSKEMPKSYGRNILGGARANPHPLQSPPLCTASSHTCGSTQTIHVVYPKCRSWILVFSRKERKDRKAYRDGGV